MAPVADVVVDDLPHEVERDAQVLPLAGLKLITSLDPSWASRSNLGGLLCADPGLRGGRRRWEARRGDSGLRGPVPHPSWDNVHEHQPMPPRARAAEPRPWSVGAIGTGRIRVAGS